MRLSKIITRPSDGGRLMTEVSQDLVSAANYVSKTNWRRAEDSEVVREGNVLFAPVNGVSNQHAPTGAVGPCRGLWEAVRPNGDKRLVYATATQIFDFNFTTGAWTLLGSGYSTGSRRWQGASSDGWLFLNNGVDLPLAYRIESGLTQIKELREVGIAFVDTLCASNGFLLLGGVAEIPAANLSTWMNGATPYGVVAPASTNHVRYKIVCSDYLKPTNFSPVITGTIQSATKNQVTLDFPCSAFPVGAKLAVIGAGIDGGVLGGGEGIEDGVPVTNVAGKVLTLGASADAALTYPLTVQVTRFADTSTFSSSSSIQDDGSPIVAMIPLKRTLVVFRETGIFSGRFTGQVETPFVFTPEYSGADVPAYPHAVAEVTGDYLVYPSGNRFFYYDGAGAPTVHTPTDSARSLFYSGASKTLSFATHNPVTKEVWFVSSTGTLAYDYLRDTCSFIDTSPEAASPISAYSEPWFVSKESFGLARYGLALSGPLTYKRNGAFYKATLTFGVTDFGDPLSQKVLRGYSVLLGSGAKNPVLKLTIKSGNDSQDLSVRMSETMTDLHDSPLVSTFFRDTFFQDSLEWVDTQQTPCRLTGRVVQVYDVATRGSTKTHHGYR